MRIHGKSLPEIFAMLPWPYKIVVITGTAFFLFAVPYSLHFFMTVGAITDKVEPLSFPGLASSARGVMDPAVTSDGSQVIMAHTVVNNVTLEGKSQFGTEIDLERATPPCRSWLTVPSAGIPMQEDDATGPQNLGQLDHGFWNAETPAIVYDKDDKDKPWKIYAYKYYWTGKTNIAQLYSVIVEKTAPTAMGPWSQEDWLFSAKKGAPPDPYDTIPRIHLADLSPDLADVYFYSRPSVIYTGGALFMTLSAFRQDAKIPDRVVMLASADHGVTWSYLGAPLLQSDAPKMGSYTQMGGATLLEYKGQIYLAAVLGNNDAEGLGTFMLPFADMTKALLKRDDKGAPVIARHVPRNSMQPSRVGGGYAAYSSDCKIGMLVSEFSDIRHSFQIFKTYKLPVGE